MASMRGTTAQAAPYLALIELYRSRAFAGVRGIAIAERPTETG